MNQISLEVADDLVIDPGEIRFRTSRSSGPGGQNVNKVETRVTLLFDLEGSECLSREQKDRIASRLATRINRDGVLRVVSSRHRTQAANRRAASERFVDLLSSALEITPERKPTRPTRSAKQSRLQAKRRRGQLKKDRRRDDWD